MCKHVFITYCNGFGIKLCIMKSKKDAKEDVYFLLISLSTYKNQQQSEKNCVKESYLIYYHILFIGQTNLLI